MLVLSVAVLLGAVGLLLVWLSARRRKRLGLPAGRVVYSDTGIRQEVEKPLYDRTLGLAGRPDYLVRQGRRLIPVEVKSAAAPPVPYDSHVFQVLAYCLLVERQMGTRPPYGLLQYADRTFRIDFTFEAEERLLDLLAEIRRAERRGGLPERSHTSAARCRACGFREICDQRLT